MYMRACMHACMHAVCACVSIGMDAMVYCFLHVHVNVRIHVRHVFVHRAQNIAQCRRWSGWPAKGASTDFGSMSGPLCANTGHQSECFAVPACDP